MDVAFYVAVAENRVIGRDGGLPWRLSTDLKRFKADTIGKPVVMGRRTWDSVGRPLPGRTNIVVTRDRTFLAPGAEVVGSLDDAFRLATVRARCLPQAGEIAVIGGGDIFREAMPLATRLHVTHVLAAIEGDTYFPEIDSLHWTPVRAEEVPAGERDSHPTRHVVYHRTGAVDPAFGGVPPA